jgi:hypothetical protein
MKGTVTVVPDGTTGSTGSTTPITVATAAASGPSLPNVQHKNTIRGSIRIEQPHAVFKLEADHRVLLTSHPSMGTFNFSAKAPGRGTRHLRVEVVVTAPHATTYSYVRAVTITA